MRYAAASDRRDELLQMLHAQGYVAYSEAAARFAVSEMTIRRDVEALADEGAARRVTGGASLPGRERGPAFGERTTLDVVAKRAIARAAADRVAPGDVVAIDAGTTVLQAVDALPSDVTVVTHSLPAITAVAGRGDLALHGLGGAYGADTQSFAGLATSDQLSRHAVDVALVSATAVDPTGALCTNPGDADVKRALVRHARQVVVLADSSKLGARAPLRFATWAAGVTLVTDDRADAAELAGLRGAGADVVVVPVAS